MTPIFLLSHFDQEICKYLPNANFAIETFLINLICNDLSLVYCFEYNVSKYRSVRSHLVVDQTMFVYATNIASDNRRLWTDRNVKNVNNCSNAKHNDGATLLVISVHTIYVLHYSVYSYAEFISNLVNNSMFLHILFIVHWFEFCLNSFIVFSKVINTKNNNKEK